MQQVSFIFQLGVNIFDYFIMLYYFNLLSEKRHKRKTMFWAVGLVYIGLITYVNQVVGSSWVNLLVSVAAVVIISMFYKKEKKIGSLLIYDAIYTAMNIVAETFAICIIKILLSSTNLDLRENYICATLITKIVLLFFCYHVGRKRSRRRGILAKETEVLLFVSTVISVLISISLVDKMELYKGWHTFLYLGTALGCMYLELILYFLLGRFEKMYQQILENQKMKYELEKKEEYLKVLEEKEKEIRSIRHNLKNQLLELNIRLDAQNITREEHENQLQAKEFVDNLIETLEKEYQYTNNFRINSILKEKLNYAKEKGIAVACEIQISDTFQLERGDMGVILGNLLDNAIEASEQVENPYISIKMRQRNQGLYLEIQNNARKSRKGAFGTTKKDKENHGFGLISVKKTVEKYNGYIEVNRRKEKFIVGLVLMEK